MSDFPAVNEVHARGGRGSGGTHWITGLLPAWGWALLILIVAALGGVAFVLGVMAAVVALFPVILSVLWKVLMGFGAVWAGAGFLAKAPHAPKWLSRGRHMIRHGLEMIGAGLFIFANGLSLAASLLVLLVVQLQGGMETQFAAHHMHLPAAPSVFQVDGVNLAAQPSPATTPKP